MGRDPAFCGVVVIRYFDGDWVNHDKGYTDHFCSDGSFKFLPYQLSTVRSWLTVVTTGDGGLGFDSGEGA